MLRMQDLLQADGEDAGGKKPRLEINTHGLDSPFHEVLFPTACPPMSCLPSQAL